MTDVIRRPRDTPHPPGAADIWVGDVPTREQIENRLGRGSTVKLKVLLRELPNFTARPGTDRPHHYGQIKTPLTKEDRLATRPLAEASSPATCGANSIFKASTTRL